ncbi:hypothetical protein EDB89DRAFT_1916274 [Lactarius sanguifluus]|nr:hypothetical protein EDB89DRAFT_1916274 [Lactarius sanguifluus]
MSLPRTSPPLQSKKRKVNDLESTEEDEASVNRKTKNIRFMDPEPTQIPNESPLRYRLLYHDHPIRMKAALPSQLPENNLAAVAAVNYNHPLHNIPVDQRQFTPQPQLQAHTQTLSHPQSQSQSQPQSRFQSQPPPQQPPPPPLQPQPQSQPRQPPRSIATPVAVPGSADTKKSTPKTAAKSPGDGTLGTSTPSGTPVQATPQLALQRLRTTNHPSSRPTSHSPHPTAVVNGSASTLGSSPRVAPSPTLHAMAVAGTNAASSSSPRPPAQSAIQPQQGQPQPQSPMPSAQAKAQYAAHLQQQQLPTSLMEVVRAQAQAQGMMPTQQMFIPNLMNMSPQMLQHQLLLQQHAAQAQAGGRVGSDPMHAWQQLQMSMNGMNGIAFRQGGGQPHANLTAAQAAQVKAAQQHAQAQSQGAGICMAQRSTVQHDMDKEQWVELIRAFGDINEFRVAGELAADILSDADARVVVGGRTVILHLATALRLSRGAVCCMPPSHAGKGAISSSFTTTTTAAAAEPFSADPGRGAGTAEVHPDGPDAAAADARGYSCADASWRAGSHPMHAWQQLQTSMNRMNEIALRQGGGQPHANLAVAQAAQVTAVQAHAQARAQS